MEEWGGGKTNKMDSRSDQVIKKQQNWRVNKSSAIRAIEPT